MKARFTLVIEYDLMPECYPDNYTPEEMVAIDEDNFRKNTGMLFEFINTEMSNIVEIEVETIED